MKAKIKKNEIKAKQFFHYYWYYIIKFKEKEESPEAPYIMGGMKVEIKKN